MSEVKVTQAQINDIISKAKIEDSKMGAKTTVVCCTLENGFAIVESSSCVDPANYDHKMGMDICMDRIQDKLWMLEGYRLQCAVAVPVIHKENAQDTENKGCMLGAPLAQTQAE